MESNTASTSALALAPHEIEEHIAATNRFFQTSRLTLDDLHEYGIPHGNAARAIQNASEGFITEEQAVAVILHSIAELKAIHAAMDAANAG
jgi:hypothetical protein